MSIDDLIVATLKKEGYSGGQGDMLKQWLFAQGATAKALPDQWHEYFDAQLVPTGHINYRTMEWLESLGHLQKSYNDRWYAYWEARLALP